MTDTPTRAEIRGLRHELAVAAAEIERLQARLDKALHCISKHQGGCINGCWEALSDDR